MRVFLCQWNHTILSLHPQLLPTEAFEYFFLEVKETTEMSPSSSVKQNSKMIDGLCRYRNTSATQLSYYKILDKAG